MVLASADNGFASELSVRDYISILLRHKWLFLAVAGLVFGATLGWTAVTPVKYQSVATVVVRTNQNQQLFPSVGASQRQQFVRQPAAELEYVKSTFFSTGAGALSPAGATVLPRYDQGEVQSSELSFIATSSTPLDAQEAASAWAQHYLDTRSQNDIGEIDATIQGVEALITDLEAEKDELLAPIQPIDDALLAETDSDTISRLTTQRLSLRQSLEDDLLPVTLQLRTLSQDLSNLRIASGYVSREDNSARMSLEAGPGRKTSPRVNRNLALGGLLALASATAAVLINESYRGVINTAADIQSLAPATPVLARIPAFPRGTRSPLELASQAGSTYAQALERVVSSMLYLRAQQPDRQMKVLFTSAVPSEGKTTVVSHLAMRLAATPTKTIVIDADLRRPDIHTALSVPQHKPGLSHLLLERRSLAPHLKPLPNAANVQLLCAGAATDDAATLLRQSFADGLASLPGGYDLLVVDAPPVLAVTDAEVMSQSVDVVVLVVRSGRTTRSQLTETLRKLGEARANVIGFVLVAAESNAANGYSNSYQYEIDENTERLPRKPHTSANTNGVAPSTVMKPAPPAKVPTQQPQRDLVPTAKPAPRAQTQELVTSKAKTSQAKTSRTKSSRATTSRATTSQATTSRTKTSQPKTSKPKTSKPKTSKPKTAKPASADTSTTAKKPASQRRAGGPRPEATESRGQQNPPVTRTTTAPAASTRTATSSPAAPALVETDRGAAHAVPRIAAARNDRAKQDGDADSGTSLSRVDMWLGSGDVAATESEAASTRKGAAERRDARESAEWVDSFDLRPPPE